MTDFAQYLIYAWQLMNTEFTIYGLTTSYGKLYLYSLFAGLLITALTIFFNLRG